MSSRSWVYAATVVAVVAMTVAEGLAAEADLGTSAEKWAYVPNPPDEGARQKKAVELLQKSQKGRWVHVPLGTTAESVIQKEELLKAKILSDASAARKAAERKSKAKKREMRMARRILNAKDEKKALKEKTNGVKEELVEVNDALSGNVQDFAAMKDNMKRKEKLHVELEKYVDQGNTLDELLERDRIKKEKRQKILIKKVEQANKAKAEAQLLKIKEMMEQGAGNPDKMQSLMDKFEEQSTADLKESNDLRVKEKSAFDIMKGQSDKVEELRKEVNKLKKATDEEGIAVQITKTRDTLTRFEKTDQRNNAKEIASKDKLENENNKQMVEGQTEARAVKSLQREFKKADHGRKNVGSDEAGIAGDLAKATAQIKVYSQSLKEHKADAKALLLKLQEVKVEAEKETSAKKKVTNLASKNDQLKQSITTSMKKLIIGKHDVGISAAQQKAAASGIEEAKAKKKAADKSKAADMELKIENAKNANLAAVAKYEKSQADLAAIKKGRAEDREKEGEVKKQLAIAQIPAAEEVDVSGPDTAYENSEKSVSKFGRLLSDAKVRKGRNQAMIDNTGPRLQAKLDAVKRDQTEAVDRARGVKKQMAVDRVNEQKAKHAEQVMDETNEAGSKKTSDTEDELDELKAEEKKRNNPKLKKKLKEEQAKLHEAILKLDAEKDAATKAEHMRKLAVRRVSVSKMAMNEAVGMKKEVSAKTRENELSTKDDIATKQGAIANVNDARAASKAKANKEVSEKTASSDSLEKEKNLLDTQQAQANAQAATLEAEVTAMNAKELRAGTEEKVATTTAAVAEAKMHQANMAMMKAKQIRSDNSNTLEETLHKEDEAAKEAQVARSKANLAKASTLAEENAVDAAGKNAEELKSRLEAAHHSTAAKSQELLDAKAEEETNVQKAETATLEDDKKQYQDAAQAAKVKVATLTHELSELHKRVEVLDTAWGHSKVLVTEKDAELKQSEKQYNAIHAKEKINMLMYQKEKASADVRAQKAKDLLTRMDQQVTLLKEEGKAAKERLEAARKSLASSKSKFSDDCAKEKVLQQQKNAADVEATALQTAAAVKLAADKTTAEAGEAQEAASDAAVAAATASADDQALVQTSEKSQKTNAEIGGLEAQLAAVKNGEGAVGVAAFEEETGEADEERTVAKDRSKLAKAKVELGQAEGDNAKASKGRKLSDLLRSVSRHRTKVARETKETLVKAHMRATSEGAILDNENKVTTVKEELTGLESKTEPYEEAIAGHEASLEQQKTQLQDLKGDVVKQQKLAGVYQARVTLLRSQISPTAVIGATATNVAPQLEEYKEKLTNTEDQLKELRAEIKKLESNDEDGKEGIVQLESMITEAQDKLKGNKAMIQTAKDSLLKLSLYSNQTKSLAKKVDAAKSTAKKFKKVLQESREGKDSADEHYAASVKKLIKKHVKVNYRKGQLKESEDNQSELDKAAETERTDKVKAKAIQDQLLIDKQKADKEKVDLQAQQAADANAKEIAGKQEETAAAMRQAAKKAAAEEKTTLANKAEVEAAHSNNVDEVVKQFLSKVDIHALVLKSKKAMADIVLKQKGLAAPTPPPAQDPAVAEAKKKKIADKEMADQKQRMKVAMGAKQETMEMRNKATEKVKEHSENLKKVVDNAKSTVDKMRTERQTEVTELNRLKEEYDLSQAKVSRLSKKYANTQGTSTELTAATSRNGMNKLLLEAKEQRIKELDAALETARTEAEKAEDDAQRSKNQDEDNAEARSKEVESQANENMETATKTSLETANNNAPVQSSAFKEMYNRANGLLTGKIDTTPAGEIDNSPGSINERKAKTGELINSAQDMMEKIVEHNKIVKKTREAAEKKAAKDAINGAATKAETKASASVLAEQAQTAATSAEAALKKITDLEVQISTLTTTGGDTASLTATLDAAKKEEITLRKTADEKAKLAKEAAEDGSKDAMKTDNNAKEQAEKAALKAQTEESEARSRALGSEVAGKEAMKSQMAAQQQANDYTTAGNSAGAQVARTQAANYEKLVKQHAKEVAEERAEADAAAEKAKIEADAAEADVAAPKKLHPMDHIPEVAAITHASVSKIVEGHIRTLVTDALHAGKDPKTEDMSAALLAYADDQQR